MADLYMPGVKKLALQRYASLKSGRSSYDSHYQLLARNFVPRASRFVTSDRNQQGGQKHNNIIDSTGTRALRTLAAGMMAGMTSPARPWFTLRTPDDELNKSHNVRVWMQAVTDLMLRIFRKSNTYNALHNIYRELGLFGTAANFISPDFDNVIHHYTPTTGEFVLALDNKMMVNTIYRELQITLDQAAGWGFNLTQAQLLKVDTAKGDETMDILHSVEPRRQRDATKRDNRNMPFRSLYVQIGGSDEEQILQESGFRTFPAMCPRWDVTSNDTYGASPAMDALGDVLQLQQEQFRKAEAIDYKARPPLQAPTALKDQDSDFLPGGVSFYDGTGPGSGIRTAFDVNLDLSHIMADIQDVRQRIDSSLYVDIFLPLSNIDQQMTATEVAERHEEKLLMLGPVLERLHNELLIPLIDSTFARIIETGIAPPPPQELQGMDIQAEFVSILAQAQRAISVNATDRFVANLGSIAAIKPNILDRFDEDAWVEHYSDVLGVDASLIVASDQAAFIRQQRAQMQQQQMQQQQANLAADTASKAAGAAASATAAGITLPTNAGYGIGTPDGVTNTPGALSPGGPL